VLHNAPLILKKYVKINAKVGNNINKPVVECPIMLPRSCRACTKRVLNTVPNHKVVMFGPVS